MNTPTKSEYYSNIENLGYYQWVTFNEFIAELEIIALDKDSYINNTTRSQLVNTAKQGVKLLQKNVRKDIKTVRFNVSQNLLFIYPQDYVNWVSLSAIQDDGSSLPIYINKPINTTQAEPQTKGHAVFNDMQSRISFSSNMQGQDILLEYYSDGLFAWYMSDSQRLERELKPVRIHKDLKELLIKYVYQEIIGYRRNVPANEKQRAKQEYKTYLHKAKLDKLGITYYTIGKVNQTIKSNPNQIVSNIDNNITTPATSFLNIEYNRLFTYINGPQKFLIPSSLKITSVTLNDGRILKKNQNWIRNISSEITIIYPLQENDTIYITGLE